MANTNSNDASDLLNDLSNKLLDALLKAKCSSQIDTVDAKLFTARLRNSLYSKEVLASCIATYLKNYLDDTKHKLSDKRYVALAIVITEDIYDDFFKGIIKAANEDASIELGGNLDARDVVLNDDELKNIDAAMASAEHVRTDRDAWHRNKKRVEAVVKQIPDDQFTVTKGA